MLFANNANTTLASSLTTGATSMSVTSATGFPSPTGVQYFYCTLADAATQTTIEIVKVTSVSGTTFAITRAQDGTSATAFAAGAVVSLRLVRASLNDFPKLDETNTFNADQAISGQLTSSAGLATTGTFTATAPSDGLVMDYATGFGRFSAFAGDGFQWYNAGIANTKLMQLSSSGVITTATWNGTTVGVAYGGTGLTTLTAGYIPYGNGTSAFNSSSNLQFDGTNLGIGAAPSGSYKLQVTNSTVYVGITSDGSNGIAESNGAFFLRTTTANPLVFGTGVGATERARIDSSGNLLVGTTSKPSGGSGRITSYIGSASDNCFGGTYSGAGGAGVGIDLNYANTTGTGYQLYFRYNNTGVGSITSTSSSTSYTTSSDYRLKENVSPMIGALDTVAQLKPVTYDWISDKSKGQGFIAHELQAVVPDCVTGEKDAVDSKGNPVYQGIDTSFLVATLTAAIQELNNKFDAYVASHP